jgi:hypothetical protein
MHSGVQPRLLPQDQVAFAINVTFRNGLPRTRPLYRRLALTFPDASTQANATQALFQDASFYQAFGGGDSCLVASIGGRLFRYLVGDGSNTVDDISVNKTTTVIAPGFTIPAIGTNVTVPVTSTTGFQPNTRIIIAGANYIVVSIIDSSHLEVSNVDGIATGVVVAGATVIYSDLNDATNPNAWMWQAEDFLIVQNGAADPLFFDGASTRRSLGQAGNELPAGCMGVYVQGRVWMVLAGTNQGPSNSYMAGDLVYTHGFTDGYDGRSAVLQTQELSLFSGGAPFSVPVSAGPITGMGTTAVMDTSLGQGSLVVMTHNSVFSVNVPLDRALWFQSQSPLVVVSLPNYGTTGQNALVTVNGDLWYRSIDGIRSYQVGRRDIGTWVNTPLSVEMERVLLRDTQQLLGNISGVLFNNRLLMGCAPFTIDGRGVACRGLIALDFNNVSTLTTRSQPCYDGLWTGVRILKIIKGTFNGVDRCFAFAIGCDNDIQLWELLRDEQGYFDWDGTQDVATESVIETRSMGWSDNGNKLKRLLCADLYLDRLAGNDDVTIMFKYRSDEDPFWNSWHEFQLCAPIHDCRTADCPTFQDVKEQYRTYVRLPDPSDTPCSPITRRSPRTGYEFQLYMWWKGFLQWNRVHTWSAEMSDSVVQGCPTTEDCTLLKGCDEPWFGYSVDGCGQVPPIPPPTPPGPPGPPGGSNVPSIITEGGTPIVEEPGSPGIRTEDQLPVPPGSPPPNPPPPAPNVPPVWPVPAPFPCVGDGFDLSPLQVVDFLQSPPLAGYVGVPNVADPTDYVNTNGAPGCLQAWTDAVWANFLASGTPYSQARVVWYLLPTSGKGFFATAVFPNQSGGYIGAINLDYKLVVEWCP